MTAVDDAMQELRHRVEEAVEPHIIDGEAARLALAMSLATGYARSLKPCEECGKTPEVEEAKLVGNELRMRLKPCFHFIKISFTIDTRTGQITT